MKLFPLPEVTLFPGGGLPLHVFEPRYRKLVKDALASDRVVALPRLESGLTQEEYLGRPPILPVMGAGVIADHRELPDGRYHVLVRGIARARLVQELPPEKPYREAALALLDDLASEVPQAEGDALAACLVELSRHADDEAAAALARLGTLAGDPPRLADQIAAVFLPPERCQALLAQVDPLVRVRDVTAALAELMLSAAGKPGRLRS